jgi:TonB family protein
MNTLFARALLLPLALIITLGIFLFMQRLINVDASNLDRVDIAAAVSLYKPPPPEDPEPEEEPEPEAAEEEPKMESLSAAVDSPEPVTQVDAPALDVGMTGIDIGPVGEGWSAPAVAGTGLEGLGQDNSGYVEVVPYTTRSPAVPELAWKNKVNGWVLVVFNVDRDGTTKNIRILDANPRGVFEETVIDAVSSWRYSVNGIKNYRGDMVLTQKIELKWKNYQPEKGLW